MIIILLFFSTILILNKNTVIGWLSFFIALSIIFGFLIGLSIEYVDMLTVRDLLVTILILYLFVYGFKNYSFNTFASNHKRKNLTLIFQIVLIGSIFGVVLNAYLMYISLEIFLLESANINNYKNMGIAKDFLQSSNNEILSTLSLLLSSLGYFSLAFHFYFIIHKDRKRSFLSLIGSFNIFIPSLFSFARGGLVAYLFIYFFYWVYSHKSMDRIVGKKLKNTALILFSGVIFIFIYISYNRFSLYNSLEHTALHSILSYYSQWIENGILLLGDYESDKSLLGSSVRYFPNKILEIFGNSTAPIQDLKMASWGELSSSFVGLPAILVYDFGYVGAILFSLLFFLIVKACKPKMGEVSPINFMIFFGKTLIFTMTQK